LRKEVKREGTATPLLNLEQLHEDLICPRCSAPLAGGLARCAHCGLEFSQADGLPVLVDFEDSVLDRSIMPQTGARSPVARANPGRMRSAVNKAINGENRVAERQARQLVTLTGRLQPRPRVLVVGGGAIGSGLEGFYARQDVDIVAFDIYSSKHVQFVADAHRMPLKNQSVDGVIIQAVLEHVLEPQRVVAEIQRVLRPNGAVYADTPFLQHVHEGAYDFTRFTESGHRYLFRYFREIDSGVVAGPGTQMVWSIDYLLRGLFRSRAAGRLGRLAFFWVRWLDRLVPFPFAVDSASGCYFLGTLSERPISPRDAVLRYGGAQSR
jgi:SAM-dependent methyltransferase